VRLNCFKLIIIRISLYRFFSISRLSYSLFFCPNISVKAAVNSICLRTCISFSFACFSKRVQK